MVGARANLLLLMTFALLRLFIAGRRVNLFITRCISVLRFLDAFVFALLTIASFV
jgi:hypothetical protein